MGVWIGKANSIPKAENSFMMLDETIGLSCKHVRCSTALLQ